MASSRHELALAAYLLQNHFGEAVGRVGTAVMHAGCVGCTLKELEQNVNDALWIAQLYYATKPLGAKKMRDALACLVQHNCVAGAQRGKRGPYVYRADYDAMLWRSRFPHYLQAVREGCGEIAMHVLREVLQHGRVVECALIASLRAGFLERDVEEAVSVLKRNEFLEIVEMDTGQRRKMGAAPADEGERSAVLRARYRDLNLVLCRKLLSSMVDAISHLDAVGATVFDALLAGVTLENGAPVMQPQTVSDIRARLPPHITDQMAIEQLRQIASDSSLDGLVIQTTKSVTESAVVEQAEPTKKKTRRVTPMKALKSVLSTRTEEAFSVVWPALRAKLRFEFCRKAVRRHLGLKAARIYALLDRPTIRMMEVDQICDHCLVSRKEAFEILNRMTVMHVVSWQEIPKGQQSAQCTPQTAANYGTGFWLYYIDRNRTVPVFRDLVAKALLNQRIRFDAEVSHSANVPKSLDCEALYSAQDKLEKSFLTLEMTYLGIRDL